jgi:lysophospholipase L1-like esterase
MKIFLLALLCACGLAAQNPPAGTHWVATWTTAQQIVRPEMLTPPGVPIPQPQPSRFPRAIDTLNNQTVRMIARSSIGGRGVRIQLSNAFGNKTVEVGGANIALRAIGAMHSGIVPASNRELLFGKRRTVVIPPGAVVVSDPVPDLNIPPLTDLAISLYLPHDTGAPTQHMFGLHTTYISGQVSGPGDFTAAPEIKGAVTTASYFWLSAVLVLAPARTGVIAAFGDSITDGDQSTPDTNSMWPAVLAGRLIGNKATAHLALVNEGIAGNRVLNDNGTIGGAAALARFDRDVLRLPGLRWVMVLEGINDIGRPGPTGQNPTAEDLINGHRQLIAAAHTHGVRIVGCTLTPRHGTQPGPNEEVRQALNRWIRNGGEYDAVVDFEAAVRDPANPTDFREGLYADGVHPNDAGYKLMAESVDLSTFLR